MAWYHVPGNEQDVVISTQVRMARNLSEFPFPARLDAVGAREVIARVGGILEKNGFCRTDFEGISRAVAYALVEKHYASPLFVGESLPHALFLNEPCNLSVMVCEEDHIRMQAVYPGLSLRDALEGVSGVESILDASFELAFDERLGYLTQNPAELGTAMRASVMLCLPLLSRSGRTEALTSMLGRMGLSLRELSDREHPSSGALYRLSTRITLGMSEEEAINTLEEAARRLIEQERRLRTTVTGAELDRLTDRVRRAEGILCAAHLLSADELLSLLADVRLGAAMGILTDVRVETLTSLLIESMPATLSLSADTEPRDDRERDLLRARLVKERLSLGHPRGA